jgi:hypothetical protein
MDIGEIGWGDMDWIHLVQITNKWGSLVKTVMNFRFHKSGGIA